MKSENTIIMLKTMKVIIIKIFPSIKIWNIKGKVSENKKFGKNNAKNKNTLGFSKFIKIPRLKILKILSETSTSPNLSRSFLEIYIEYERNKMYDTPMYFTNSKIISCCIINVFKPMDSNIVWIKQPISKPIKNAIPYNFPDFDVMAVKYRLSGPGLIARRKLDNAKENNIMIKRNWL